VEAVSDRGLHDVVVIGAGSAGLSAAVECADIALDVVALEAEERVGGQVHDIPHTVRNVATTTVTPPAVADALEEHAVALGDRLRRKSPATVVDVAAGRVETALDSYRARTLVIATGSRRRELAVAPEGAFGGAVTYLVEDHLPSFVGRAVAVIGGGDSAVLDALQLARAGSDVTLVHRSAELHARSDLLAELAAEPKIAQMAGFGIERLIGTGLLEAVELRGQGSTVRLGIERMVLKLGREPNTDLVRGQVGLGTGGGIDVDADLRTTHPSTFAVGDVVEGTYERIAVALGQGSVAARSVLRSLGRVR
jgi:thioredoxin reductase (NADPH)